MSNPYESTATTPTSPSPAYGFVAVRRIGVLSCAKMLGALYVVFGLIFGGIMTLVALLGAANPAMNGNAEAGVAAIGFGVGSIIILPLLYGLMGFIGGAIMAFFYNLIAGAVGGIEIQMSENF